MSQGREFLALFFAFLAIASLVAWVSANPPATEQFAALSALGPLNIAGVYFPGNNRTVSLNQPVSWNIQVYNHMGSSQLFLVYVFLANRTIPGPDASTNTPTNRTFTPFPLLQEYHAVVNNETWNLPLQWSVTNRTSTGSSVNIHSMMINNQQVQGLGVSGLVVDNNNGTNFRLVIELWSYDIPSHGFLFSYVSNKSLNSVFNQIWFTVHN